MKTTAYKLRDTITGSVYRGILKPIFFKSDPEDVHDRMSAMGVKLGSHKATRGALKALFGYTNKSLEQDVLGMHFTNPIGLAAGFDKNAELYDVIPAVGFGWMEMGSITGEVCVGNPKPRFWRLPKSESLVVYYGLKNPGCEVVAEQLNKRLALGDFVVPVGTSVAMTNCAANTDIQSAIDDYAKAFEKFKNIGAYTTINISCPNAIGGQPFIESENLELLLTRLDTIVTKKTVFVKLSPDISIEQADQILDVLEKHRVHGVICTNLTKKRDTLDILDMQDKNLPKVGGISGKAVREQSDALLAHIYRRQNKLAKPLVVVGCGGIFDAHDAYRKIRLGATLLQMITGMIYQGPQVIGEINRGLVELLKKDGFTHISQAIGIDSLL